MKNLFIMTAVSAMLLAGCSNDEFTGNDAENSVKVEIGTKAPVITAKAALFDENWANTTVSVWGLANNAEVWASGNASCLLENVAATVSGATGNFSLKLDKDYYYPVLNDMHYSFYAYHPAGTAELLDNSLKMNYTITGAEDVLWGQAVATDLLVETGKKGYNARYLRNGGTAPNIHFRHMLTRFTFEVKGGDETAKQIVIDAIRLENVPNQVTLAVADKNAISQDYMPKVEATGSGLLELKDQAGLTATMDNITTEVQQIGESLMVPASQLLTGLAAEKTYTVLIDVHSSRPGSTYKQTFRIKIPVPAGAVNGFEAGSSYKVGMTVYGEKDIVITTSLEPWNTSTPEVNLGELN